MPSPSANIYSIATDLVTQAHALELAAGNEKWSEVTDNIVSQRQQHETILLNMEGIAVPPPRLDKDGKPSAELGYGHRPATNVEVLRKSVHGITKPMPTAKEIEAVLVAVEPTKATNQKFLEYAAVAAAKVAELLSR